MPYCALTGVAYSLRCGGVGSPHPCDVFVMVLMSTREGGALRVAIVCYARQSYGKKMRKSIGCLPLLRHRGTDYLCTHMRLQELFKAKGYDQTTDKGSVHSYLDGYYGKEFSDRDAVLDILEIGVCSGGSLVLFSEWMPNARVVGLDIDESSKKHIEDNIWGADTRNIQVYIMDAYTKEALDMFDDSSFDYVIDDGPHTLESMIYAVEYWLDKVKPGGKLVIEDVQQEAWYGPIEKAAHQKGAEKITIFDLRTSSGSRYDDIIIEIQK